MSKMLIIYYSWSNGNTKRIANMIKNATGADITEIDTVTPYEGSYEEVVDQGQDEVNRGYMPPIKPLDVDLNNYEVIVVGTPTWWYTMAPAVKTFFNENDFTGKTVIPFMTNGGWPGHVIKDMEKACEGAKCVEPMEIQFDSTGGDHLETSEKEIKAWIENVKKYS